MLPSNTTHYGSQVEYVCDANYEIHGPGRRICLENATWSSNEPICQGNEISKLNNNNEMYIIIFNIKFPVTFLLRVFVNPNW